MWRVNLVTRLSSITVVRTFPMAQQVDWGVAPSQIPDLASDKCEGGVLLMISFLGRSTVDFIQRWMMLLRLGATSIFADYDNTDFAALSISTWVWALIWVSNLGLDLIGWFLSVMLGFVVFWIPIWNSGDLLWAFSFDTLWNWTLCLSFFGYIGRRLPSIQYMFLHGVCMVGHTTNYIGGRFSSVDVFFMWNLHSRSYHWLLFSSSVVLTVL